MRRAIAILGLISWSLGCGASEPDANPDALGSGAGTKAMGGSSGSGGSQQESCALAKDPGERVVVDCATQVLLHDAGNGFQPQPAPGSECEGPSSYTLSLPDGELEWSICTVQVGPWTLAEGSHTLTASELQSALQGLHEVTVWDEQMLCGADKPTLTIEVTTPDDAQVYTDSFYSCSNLPDRIYVDHIDAAFSALRDIAQKAIMNDPPTNPNGQGFSVEHAADIQRDCQETVLCLTQNESRPPGDDPINDCVRDTSMLLDGDPTRQAEFLAKVERCREVVVCDYVNCVQGTR